MVVCFGGISLLCFGREALSFSCVFFVLYGVMWQGGGVRFVVACAVTGYVDGGKDGLQEGRFIGNALACIVKCRSVCGCRTNDVKPCGIVHSLAHVKGPEGDDPLVVVHGKRAVEMPVHGISKESVCSIWAKDAYVFFFCNVFYDRCKDFRFLISQES